MQFRLFVSLLLVVTGAWNLFIWPQFFKRIAADDRSRDADGRTTTFYRVHAIIIGVSLLLGLAVGAVGAAGLWTLLT